MTNEKKLKKWNYTHAGIIIFALVITLLLNGIAIFLAAGIISFFMFILLNLKSLKEFKPFGGYANWVTFIRILLVFILGFVSFNISDYQIVIIAILIVVLDGADGYLARKFNQQSRFGAYFDIETDAFYVALISLIIYKKEYIAFWILIPGFLRYVYVLFIRLIGFHHRKEKRSRFTQVIAVLFFIGLLSPFILPFEIYYPVLITVSALIIISFLYSFLSILNQRIDED